MTHELLQTDIDLAKRLMAAGGTDAEIVTALGYRRISPDRAARLVEDLRNGVQVESDEVPSKRLSTQRRRSGASAGSASESASKRRERREPSSKPWFTVLATLSVLLCIGVVVWLSRHNHERARVNEEAAPSAETVVTSAAPNSKALHIEIDENGLQIGRSAIRHGAVFQALLSVLGPPSRTNLIDRQDNVVYVFDRFGVLMYPGRGGQTNSIVIDFEGNGGTNSATTPFSGTITIEGKSITTNTDPKALTAFEKLGLAETPPNSGTFNLKYQGLNLIFACLRRSDRLSLVEIDLP